jgi:hypothetical protein
MSSKVFEFSCEGHRLLVESRYSSAEIVRLTGIPKQRISEWKGGQKRPTHDARGKLEKAIAIPARTWDQPPTRRQPTEEKEASPPLQPKPPPSKEADAVPDLKDVDLPALGLTGLEQLAGRLRALGPTLPPREHVSCLQAEARVIAVHEQLQQKRADAREEYLASNAFQDDARLIAACAPGVCGAPCPHGSIGGQPPCP